MNLINNFIENEELSKFKAKFKIKNLKVGCNFIDVTIENIKGGNEVEFMFNDLPIDMVNKTLDVYGISLNKEQLKSYYGDFECS